MTNNQQFDEQIREQFSNYLPDVHPRIWENIVAERERRKPVGFWVSFFSNRNRLVLLGLLIVISTAGTWLYISKPFSLSGTKPVAETKSGINNNDLQNNNNPVSSRPADATTLNGSGPLSATDNAAGNNISSTTPGGTKLRVSVPSSEDDAEPASQANNNNPSRRKRPTGLGNVLVIATQAPGTDEAEDEFSGQGTLLGRLSFEAGKYAAGAKKRNKPSLSFSPIMPFPDCPVEKNAAGNKKYIEIYGGPDYAFRTLSDTGSSVYLQKRKESAKFKSAFSAGVRYTRVFNNSMSVRGGINYSQINERFTFTQGGIVQITYIIDANGDTTGTYITTGTRHKTTINKYRSIDVPIVVGYEVGNGKLHANINAGVVVNVYSWQKGEVLDNSLNPVSITTGKSSSPYQFKTNAGVGFIGGVSVYYKLNDRLHVMAEPYFRYNFTPMNKENITLKQKYHTAGLRLGIRLDLK